MDSPSLPEATPRSVLQIGICADRIRCEGQGSGTRSRILLLIDGGDRLRMILAVLEIVR